MAHHWHTRRASQLCCSASYGCAPETGADEGWQTIAGQYGNSPGPQQHFGRVDPFCLFAVLPMLVVAGLVIWGGIAILGVALIFLSLGIVVVDSWANRPRGRSGSRYHEDY
jgi:hypothetical protein